MATFLYRCPITRQKVQGRVADEVSRFLMCSSVDFSIVGALDDPQGYRPTPPVITAVPRCPISGPVGVESGAEGYLWNAWGHCVQQSWACALSVGLVGARRITARLFLARRRRCFAEDDGQAIFSVADDHYLGV
jgi:hypothetical protein